MSSDTLPGYVVVHQFLLFLDFLCFLEILVTFLADTNCDSVTVSLVTLCDANSASLSVLLLTASRI